MKGVNEIKWMLNRNRRQPNLHRWMAVGFLLSLSLLLVWGKPAAAEPSPLYPYHEAAVTATATAKATSRIPTLTNATPLPQVVPLVVVTAQPDGSVVHVVGYGQTLYSIALAYGVQIEEIRRLNGIATGSNSIYANQKLLIRPAGSVTQAPASAAPATAAAAPTQQAAALPTSPPAATVASATTAAAPATTVAAPATTVAAPATAAAPQANGDTPVSPWVAGGLGFAGGMVLMVLFQRLYNRLNRSGE